MLLSAGLINFGFVTMQQIHENKHHLKTIQMQRQVAITAQRSETPGARREALSHYVSMLDYVIEMLTLKIKLMFRALFKRAIGGVIPGFQYRNIPKDRVKVIQRFIRGHLRRKFFKLALDLERQKVEHDALMARRKEMKERLVGTQTFMIANVSVSNRTIKNISAVIIQRFVRYLKARSVLGQPAQASRPCLLPTEPSTNSLTCSPSALVLPAGVTSRATPKSEG